MPDSQNKPISEVTIIGGGTAGWMTAALFSRLLSRGFRIRLVESDAIGTIGVGEATIPAIQIFNRMAGIDEGDLLRSAQASFKLGIEFVNWREQGHSYIHGFGSIGQDLLWLHTHQFYLRYRDLAGLGTLDEFAINCALARRNRMISPDKRNPSSPLHDLDYAYHLDASLYAAYLRKRAEHQGVERVEGRVVTVDRDQETGFVTELQLDDGRRIGGDLFIDCSGMRGLLVGEVLGIPYEDWGKWLLCDRALAVPTEPIVPLPPYTRSTAHGEGWQWRIPLQTRTGNGLVYSSDHLSDEAACELLLCNLNGKPLKDPMPVRFTPGRRQKAWHKNVVAIGLSAGFLEPLESTSIHLIQTAIFRLIALFPGQEFKQADIDEYNRQTAAEYEDVRDFIIAHYKVTRRDDTPFWAYLRNMDIPRSLANRLMLFESSGRFFQHGKAELFREESWVQVLIGQGIDARPDPMVDLIPQQQALSHLRDIVEVIADNVDRASDHAAFIEKMLRASSTIHVAGVPGQSVSSKTSFQF